MAKFDVIADTLTRNTWVSKNTSDISKYKMIQLLLRDSNYSEIASNITSYGMFKDCNSTSKTFIATSNSGNAAYSALACYKSNTTVSIYLGNNYFQAVLIGWY